MNNINKKYNSKIYIELIKTTELFGKLNLALAKLENPYILTYILEVIDSISSNEIENIFSTIDEAYDDMAKNQTTPFFLYREALKEAHLRLLKNHIIRNQDLIWINKRIRNVNEGYRKTPVLIKNSKGEIIYKPVDANNIIDKMNELLKIINQENIKENPILYALYIHHKFEWIHPFSDGNGRTGRILFAILLNKYKILHIPSSIFSYSLSKSKTKYYQALKFKDEKQDNKYYEIMLNLLNESLNISLDFIAELIENKDQLLKNNVNSKNKNKIIEYLFAGVKTNNRYLVKKLNFNNKTITKYIDELINEGLIKKIRNKKYVTYKNLVLEKIVFKYFNNLK